MPPAPRPPAIPISKLMTTEQIEEFSQKSMEEIFAELADQKKIDIAGSILHSVINNNDPAAIKIMQTIMDRQGFDKDKTIPISDERFKEIIKIVAQEIL